VLRRGVGLVDRGLTHMPAAGRWFTIGGWMIAVAGLAVALSNPHVGVLLGVGPVGFGAYRYACGRTVLGRSRNGMLLELSVAAAIVAVLAALMVPMVRPGFRSNCRIIPPPGALSAIAQDPGSALGPDGRPDWLTSSPPLCPSP
jgi:hypothetical protein